MRGRSGSSIDSSSTSTRSPTPARSERSASSSQISRSSGAAWVDPSETTSRPVSSSLRKRTSSTSSSIRSTSARACARAVGTSAPGSDALSSSASNRASGVRSSWETAAVKLTRRSRYGSRELSPASSLTNGTLNKVGAMAKVLIVEDDEVIAGSMSQHLGAAGFDPVVVPRGDTGLARLRYERPDVVVLDLMLPGVDGWALIESARAEAIGTPIVVVSARGTEHDRVHALQIGADDYLVKPFSMRELVARVQAAARRGVRAQPEQRGDAIEIEELRIDPREVQAYVDGESARLTPTEFRLLYALALEQGRVATRDELLQRIWGRRETHRDRTVDVFVRRLRDKIDRRASRHNIIHTSYGVGYKLEAVEKDGVSG